MYLPDSQQDKDARHVDRLLAMKITDDELRSELDQIWFRLIDARNTNDKDLLQAAIDDLACIVAGHEDDKN